MNKTKGAKPNTRAKRATKPKAAPTVMMSVDGIDSETVTEELRLTIKQERFAQAYVEIGNASDAYRTAYDAENMKPETINRKAKELIDNGKIAARIEELREDMLARHQVTVDRVIAEYSKLAFSSIGDFVKVDADGLPRLDLSAMTRAQSSAIAEVTCEMLRTEKDGDDRLPVLKAKIKLADKRGALDSLSRVLGIFIDKHELTGAGGEKLIPESASSRDIARAVCDLLNSARLADESDEERAARLSVPGVGEDQAEATVT